MTNQPASVSIGEPQLSSWIDIWRPVDAAISAFAESLGTPQPFPVSPHGVVVDKLAFVHRQVSAHAKRDRFYAVR